MKIIGIDPSMRNTALICFEYEDSSGKITPIDSITITTEKTKNKKIRASSDLIECCNKLYSDGHDFIEKHRPQIIFAETPSGSQNASGMKSYGVSCFFLATLSPRAIEVTPQEVKMATVGSKVATKKEMIAWAFNLHPDVNWKLGKDGQPQVTTEEHLADAIAVVYAGMKTANFSQIRQFFQ